MSSERLFNYIKTLLSALTRTNKRAVLLECKHKPFGDVWQEMVKLIQSPNIIAYINSQNPSETPYVIHELIGIEPTPEIKELLCTKFECPEDIEIIEEQPKDEIDLDLILDEDDPIVVPPATEVPRLVETPKEKPVVAKEDGEDIEVELGSDEEIINPGAESAVINDLAQLVETNKVDAKPAPALPKPNGKTTKEAAPRAPKTWTTTLVGDVHDASLPSFAELGYKPEWIKIINEVKASLNELLSLKFNFFAVGIDPAGSKYKYLKFGDATSTSITSTGLPIKSIYQTDVHVMQFKSNSIQIIYVYKFRDTVGKSETMRENYVESNLIKYGPKLLEKVSKEKLSCNPVELRLMKAVSEYAKISKEIKDHINTLTEIEEGVTSTGKPKRTFTFRCRPNIISSDLIYNFREMNASGTDLISSKDDFVILGNDYKFSYPYKTSPVYLRKELMYPELFKIFDSIPSYSSACVSKIIKNTYENRLALIYHPQIETKIDSIWEECKKNLEEHAKTTTNDIIECWRQIFASTQAKNIICKGYKASVGFDTLMKKLIVHPETIKLMAYPDKVQSGEKKAKDDVIIMGPLLKISFLFGPYLLKLPMDIAWKKSEAMVSKRNSLLKKLAENMEVVDYTSGYWFYYLEHDLAIETMASSGLLLVYLSKPKAKKD